MPAVDRPAQRIGRRQWLGAGLAWSLATGGGPALGQPADPDAETLLRAGGVVLALRHALAPGTFDPPGFRLGDCSTQRNLSDEGRAQARRVGTWFEARKLKPARVRSSPWCRCVDTATLAFGTAEAWAALGSPRGSVESTNADHLRALRQALQAATARSAHFEVWVTHNFVLSDLVAGSGVGSGEGLLLRAGADGKPQLLARLAPA
jgi:phosphohistidine phosphatase SixA